MAHEIKWTPAARRDYSEIISYLYDNWGYNVAEKFTDKLEFQLGLLEKFPFLGKQHGSLSSVYQLVLGKYQTLFYTVFDNTILVMNIRDNRRAP